MLDEVEGKDGGRSDEEIDSEPETRCRDSSSTSAATLDECDGFDGVVVLKELTEYDCWCCGRLMRDPAGVFGDGGGGALTAVGSVDCSSAREAPGVAVTEINVSTSLGRKARSRVAWLWSSQMLEARSESELPVSPTIVSP